MNRVLIATDGSDGGFDAVQTGAELALASGAAATLVYVRRPITAAADAYAQRTLGLEQRQAEVAVAAAAEQLLQTGVAANVEVISGDPAHKILEVARAVEADLVVVGASRHGALPQVLLGDVSAALVRHADRPVLVARRHPAQARAAA